MQAPMRIHLVGVSGTGMGALAGLLVELRHHVSGSDTAFEPPIGPELLAWGVECKTGYEASHITPALDLVVVGNVCRKDNPEVLAAQAQGLPFTHIAGALARFALPNTSPLVVAGTHGKTTTSSLCAWLLEQSGKAPGFLIGGLPGNFGRGFRSPKSDRKSLIRLAVRKTPMVLEGDEYDTAFFEKTAKFLHYQAEVAIITSIEHDHIDIYPDVAEYIAAFAAFVRQIPETGLIVANANDPNVVRVVNEHARAPVTFYSLEGAPTYGAIAPWVAAPVATDASGMSFDLFAGGVPAGRYAIPLSGTHNLQNALAALAATTQGFGCDLVTAARALSSFKGVRRRQELVGEVGGVRIYDDFAHHPTAVRETLQALRARHSAGRLLVLFEPRSATACRNLHQAAYAESFGAADIVLLAPLGRKGLPEHEALNLEILRNALESREIQALACTSIDEVLEAALKLAAPGDSIAVLSNGAFGGIHGKLLAALNQPTGHLSTGA